MEFTVLPQLYTRDRHQIKNSRLLKVKSPTKPLVRSFQASAFTGDEQDSAGTGNSQEAGALGLSAIGFSQIRQFIFIQDWNISCTIKLSHPGFKLKLKGNLSHQGRLDKS